MDMTLVEKALVALLKDPLKHIEEFHLTSMNINSIAKPLTEAFLGTHDLPACPKLQRLSVAYPVVLDEDFSVKEQKTRKEEINQRLRRIVDARKDGGCLQHVSLGWYPVTLSSLMTDKNDLWNVEWTPLLS
jgi:hypothetical protein